MNYFLAKLWCVVSMVLVVEEEANEGGLVVAESKEHALGGTKTGEAMKECVSFGDAAVEAEVPLLLFLDLDLLRAFGREMESEGPREECVSLGGRLEEALFCVSGESVLFWSDAGLRLCEFLPGEAVVCRVEGCDCT